MPRVKLAIVAVGLAILAASSVAARQQRGAAAGPPATVLVMDTVKGIVEIETFPTDAPKSLAKILGHVQANFYRGLRVHSAASTVIEFGDPGSRNMSKMTDWGFTGSGKRIGVAETSKRPFVRGTVGYSYRKDEKQEDADTYLFILKVPSPAFVGKYAPIGRVTVGMDVVDKLAHSDVIRNITIKAATPAAR